MIARISVKRDVSSFACSERLRRLALEETVGDIKMRIWKFGDNVDTDQIIPAEYLTTGDAKKLAAHAFAKVRPEIPKEVKEGDVIVAGENFGCI